MTRNRPCCGWGGTVGSCNETEKRGAKGTINKRERGEGGKELIPHDGFLRRVKDTVRKRDRRNVRTGTGLGRTVQRAKKKPKAGADGTKLL